VHCKMFTIYKRGKELMAPLVDVVFSGKTISQTPTVTAGAYSIGDAVGGTSYI